MPRTKPAIDPAGPRGRLTTIRRGLRGVLDTLARAAGIPVPAVEAAITAARAELATLLAGPESLPRRSRAHVSAAHDCLNPAWCLAAPVFLVGQAERRVGQALQALDDAAGPDCPCAACVAARQAQAIDTAAPIPMGGTHT